MDEISVMLLISFCFSFEAIQEMLNSGQFSSSLGETKKSAF